MKVSSGSLELRASPAELFLLLGITCYVVYPAWFLPGSTPLRITAVIAVLLYLGLGYRFVKPWFGDIQIGVTVSLSRLGDWLYRSLKTYRLLWAFLAVLFGLHLYPMTHPITIGGDEAGHVWYVLKMSERASILLTDMLGISFLSFLRILASALLIGAVFIGLTLRGRRRTLDLATWPSPAWLFVLLAGVVGVVIYVALLRNQPYDAAIHRYPPLGKVALLLSYTLFGVNEFAARLPSVVFALLAGVYVFKTICLFHDRGAGVLGFGVLLLMPGFFYYGNLAYLEMGVIFFICASGFYFLRHLRDHDAADFVLAMFLFSAGFVYKQYAAGLLPVYAGYVGFLLLTNRQKHPFSFYAKAMGTGVGAVLPWSVLASPAVGKGFDFSADNLLSLEVATRYARNLPGQVTYPIVILFAAGMLWGLLRKDKLVVYCGVAFGVFYLLINFLAYELGIGMPRFMTVLYPPMAITSAVFLSGAVARLLPALAGRSVHRRKASSPVMRDSKRGASRTMAPVALYTLLLAFLVTESPLNPAERGAQYGHYYVRLDDAFEYIKRNLPPGEKWVSVSQFSPIAFYSYKHATDMTVVSHPESQWQIGSPADLSAWMREREVAYALIILPHKPAGLGPRRPALHPHLERLLTAEEPLLQQLDHAPAQSGLSLVATFHGNGGRVKIMRRIETPAEQQS